MSITALAPLAFAARPGQTLRPERSNLTPHRTRLSARLTAFSRGDELATAVRLARPVVAMARVQRAAVCSLARPTAAVADGQGKLTILVAEKLGKAGIDMLRAYGTVVEAFDMSQADLCAKVSLCDALIVRSATKVRSPGPLR